jgi:hypothetical protein
LDWEDSSAAISLEHMPGCIAHLIVPAKMKESLRKEAYLLTGTCTLLHKLNA